MSTKLLKMSDRIDLKIGDITFTIAPLSYLRKQELASCTSMIGGEEQLDLLKAQAMYIKYALKKVSGIEDYSGNEYKLDFDGDILTDDCVSEILNLEEKEKLSVAAWQLLSGIKDLEDPVTGEELKGVELKVVSQGK